MKPLKTPEFCSILWYTLDMKNNDNIATNSVETVTIPRAEHERYQGQSEQVFAQEKRISDLEKQVELLTETLRLSRQKRFGASSERTSEDAMEQLSLLFNEAEVYVGQGAKEDVGSVAVAAHKRHKKHEYTMDHLPENVPVEVVEHRLSEEELVYPECGSTMTEIGKDVRRRLKLEPPKAVVVEDWYFTYACRKCEKEGIKTPVVKADRAPNFIPGSFATPDAVAEIMVQKFVMDSPLYRQEQEFKRLGIPLKRQTMSNWLIWTSEHLLTPVYDQLHKELLARDILHADETALQVLHESGKAAQSKSYMWLYRTSGDTDRPIVLYEYQPDRMQEHPKELLTGFQGYLHMDGYPGYHNLPESITVVGCWPHARRKFDEAMKSLPKGKAKNSSAAQGLKVW